MEEVDKSYNNEFELQIQELGYKWFRDNWKNSLRGFQKKFIDEKGIKYFITGYHYNFGKTYPHLKDENSKKDSYTFDVQFILDKYSGFTEDEHNFKQPIYGKSQCVNIEFSADFLPNQWRPLTTLKEVEEFYEKMWNNLGCPYYELNEY